MPDTREVVLAGSPGLRDRGPRSGPRRALAAMTAVGVAVLVILATNGWSLNRVLNTCVGQDEEEIADLRRVAAETLHDVDHESADLSGCVGSGTRGEAAVIADVPTWRQRAVANEYLAAQGWDERGHAFFSPDGAYLAGIAMERHPDGSRHAWVNFEVVD